MGQYCSTEDSYEEGTSNDSDSYAKLVSKFNERRASGNGAYGTAITPGKKYHSYNPPIPTADDVNHKHTDDWHLVSPDAAANGDAAQSGPPTSPSKDDSTNSVMLYDIQYRMTNSHIVYVLHLKFRGIPNPGWTITKRYRQFSELHLKLTKIYIGTRYRKLPQLPGKQLFSNQRLAQERQVKLGTYVRTLLAMELQSPFVADFLGIPCE